MGHAEACGHGAHVVVLALERERRRARDHAQVAAVRQAIDQLLGQAIGEVLLVALLAQVGERQHGDRIVLRQRRQHRRGGGRDGRLSPSATGWRCASSTHAAPITTAASASACAAARPVAPEELGRAIGRRGRPRLHRLARQVTAQVACHRAGAGVAIGRRGRQRLARSRPGRPSVRARCAPRCRRAPPPLAASSRVLGGALVCGRRAAGRTAARGTRRRASTRRSPHRCLALHLLGAGIARGQRASVSLASGRPLRACAPSTSRCRSRAGWPGRPSVTSTLRGLMSRCSTPLLVRVLHRLQHLQEELDPRAHRQPPLVGPLQQVLARHVLQREIRPAVVADAGVVEARDVRMLAARRGCRARPRSVRPGLRAIRRRDGVLSATSRLNAPSARCASHTSAMPPAPSRRTSRYGPTRSPACRRLPAGAGHVHRLRSTSSRRNAAPPSGGSSVRRSAGSRSRCSAASACSHCARPASSASSTSSSKRLKRVSCSVESSSSSGALGRPKA